MADLSRRGFLSSSVAAAVGAAGLGLSTGVPVTALAEDVAGEGQAAAGEVIVHVRDSSTGEMAVFNGEQETVVRDRALANRLLRAAR
jgi:hypothetical protein